VTRDVTFTATKSSGDVSAIVRRPEDAAALLVIAHGAGAGMRHPFMEAAAELLAARGVATFRYNFPYMENGRRSPDPKGILLGTVRSAVGAAREAAGDLPLFAGGKSMGGRMTSQAAADGGLEGVEGLVFFGFPLHPPGKPSVERGDHLRLVKIPMLFFQGTRDAFAGMDLIEPVARDLGARATLHVIDGADHSFRVLKSAGRTHEDVLEEMAGVLRRWVGRVAS
jgi:hypothetical protein